MTLSVEVLVPKLALCAPAGTPAWSSMVCPVRPIKLFPTIPVAQPVVSLKCDQNRRVPVVARTGEGDRLLAAGEGLHPGLCQDEIATSFVGGLEQDGVVGITGDGRGAGAAVPGPGSCQRVLLHLRNRAGRGDRLSFDRSGPAVGAACGVDGRTYQSTDLEDLHMNVVASRADGHGDRSRLTDTVADVPHFHLAVRLRVGDIAIRGLPGLVVVV